MTPFMATDAHQNPRGFTVGMRDLTAKPVAKGAGYFRDYQPGDRIAVSLSDVSEGLLPVY